MIFVLFAGGRAGFGGGGSSYQSSMSWRTESADGGQIAGMRTQTFYQPQTLGKQNWTCYQPQTHGKDTWSQTFYQPLTLGKQNWTWPFQQPRIRILGNDTCTGIFYQPQTLGKDLCTRYVVLPPAADTHFLKDTYDTGLLSTVPIGTCKQISFRPITYYCIYI
jgi:hypothetical protein